MPGFGDACRSGSCCRGDQIARVPLPVGEEGGLGLFCSHCVAVVAQQLGKVPALGPSFALPWRLSMGRNGFSRFQVCDPDHHTDSLSNKTSR
jgi:hypothetical protein